MQCFSILLLVLAVTRAQQATFSSSSRILTAEIDDFIRDVLDDWNSVAGISVAVVRKQNDGSFATETKGYGVAQRDGSSVTADTLFCIASNSKLFTAISTGLLIANESLSPRISWDTKIVSIIPEWDLMDPIAAAETTILDAMSHRTGLPGHDMMYNRSGEGAFSVIQRLKHLKPSAGFRDVYQYNNNMYSLLSYLPQALLSIPFEQYVKTNIFDPLGMGSTTFSYFEAKETGNLADGWDREGVNKSDDVLGRGTPWPMEYSMPHSDQGHFIAGAGGILSSANDIAIWLQMLLLNGNHPGTNKTVVPADVIRKVATGVSIVSAIPRFPEVSVSVYGGGQRRSSYRGHDMIQHGGDVPGFHSQVTRFPFDNVGLAVFSNDDQHGPLLVDIIKNRISDKLLGLEPVNWNQRWQDIARKEYRDRQLEIVPPPADPRPPFESFSLLSGIYTNKGYMVPFELCFLSDPQSSECKELAAVAPSILPNTINSTRPTFLVNLSIFFIEYLLLEHFDGNLFNVSVLASHP
ncbi:beta-lactamase/transpeptidase-like protein [Mycena floridula]|nr:beta-lactamase/transpeptidase-like protein [Mycena floridula]